MDREILKFEECEICASKPGSPDLCASCLNNRHVIAVLKQRLIMAEISIGVSLRAGEEYVDTYPEPLE